MDPAALLHVVPELVALLGAGGLLWAAARHRGGPRHARVPLEALDEMASAAAALNLAYEDDDRNPGASLVGSVDGFAVAAQVRPATRTERRQNRDRLRFVLEVTPRCLLPADLRVPEPLPPGTTLSWRAWRQEAWVHPPLDVLGAIEGALRVLRPLDAAALAPIAALAEDRGLTCLEPGRSGLPPLFGQVAGVAVRADPAGMRPKPYWVVSAQPKSPLAGLHVRPRRATAPASTTGNPVIDAVLTVEVPPGFAATALLSRPGLAEALLGALGDHPGSHVASGVAILRATHSTPEALASLIDEAVALAALLPPDDGPATPV